MVAYKLIQRLNPKLALGVAGTAGALAAALALLLPAELFEAAVLASGIAVFVPAAEPPLGMTARLCLALVAGGGAALAAWVALSTLLHFLPTLPGRIASPLAVRRADAHPDAPPREPLRAVRDLGFELADDAPAAPVEAQTAPDFDLTPEPVIARGMPEPASDAALEPAAIVAVEPVRAEPPAPVQPLPADLDQPLAAFDPGALLETPLPPPQPVAPLHRTPPRPPVFAEGERFETFDLSPTRDPAPGPVAVTGEITGADTVATVHSLLDRLERGIARRTPVPSSQQEPAEGLESALAALRHMAVRA